MDFKEFNANLQRYANAQAVKDFDKFLDALPVNVGYNALLAAGACCLMGILAVWFTSQELEKVSRLHAELMNVQALHPPVPDLKYTAVSPKALEPLTKNIANTFKGVAVGVGRGEGEVTISAQDADYFPQFLAGISFLQRGGRNWKVRINALCVGRDCKGPPLSATMKVEAVTLGEPVKSSTPKDKTVLGKGKTKDSDKAKADDSGGKK